MSVLLRRYYQLLNYSTYGKWLIPAAIRAILGAFDQRDGWAVIRATNAYLDQLAASDRDKATALAGFINEDPMMVCSLGLQPQGVTMPIRWLVGDGNSWIDTGIVDTSCYSIEVKVRPIKNKKYSAYFGALYDNFTFMDRITGTDCFNYVRSSMANLTLLNGENKFLLKDGIGKLNDVQFRTYQSGSALGTGNVHVYLFATMYQNNIRFIGDNDISYAILNSSLNSHVSFVPFVSQTRNGMVDLVTGTFHPNQGTGHFTDAYTLQDGVTPWTHSTP